MRLGYLLLLLAAVAFGQQDRPAGTPVTGLSVQNPRYEPQTKMLDIDLLNVSGRVVMAYALAHLCNFPDGSEERVGGSTVDYADSDESRVHPPGLKSGAIDPNDKRHRQLGGIGCRSKSGDNIGMRVEVAAVVYEDGSAEGEDRALKSIFDRRRAFRGEIEKWIERLRALRTSQMLAADARKLYEDMLAITHAEDKDITASPTLEQRHARVIRQQLLDTARGFVQIGEKHASLNEVPGAVDAILRFERKVERLRRGTPSP